MLSNINLWLRIGLAVIVSFVMSYMMTPAVKRFAESVGAVDQPSARRINDHPVPRMGGIAIICGLMLGVILFANLSQQVEGIIIGALIVAVVGAIDDIFDLNPWVKLLGQIAAAAVAISCGVVVDGFTDFISFSDTVFISKVPAYLLTALWIVGCTNAINLIDGLDGLAVGMTTISAFTLFFISLRVSDINVSVILACLIGACAGFWPFNWNPAVIFMGDVGSQTLGFILSSVSVIGLFKMHALVTMLLPVLAMAVPLADTTFAIVRRLLKGQSPFHPDKGHFHHRLLALGLTQKQAVTVLYGISIVLGIFAYLMVGSTRVVKIICLTVAFVIVAALVIFVFKIYPRITETRKNGSRDDGVKVPPSAEDDIKIYRGKGRKR